MSTQSARYTPTSEGAVPRLGLLSRVGLVWVTLVLAWTLVGVVRQELLIPNLSPDLTQVVQALLAGTLGVATVVLAARLLDRRTLRSLGFDSLRTGGRALLTGAGFWLGFAALGLGVGVAVDAFEVELAAPTPAFAGWLVLQLGLVFCFEALPEELALRGYVYTNLVERMPRWLAITGQAVLFMLWAFAFVFLQSAIGSEESWSITPDRVILFLSFGVTLALVRLWTGSLWGAIGFHWAYQTVVQLLGNERLVVLDIPGGADLDTALIFFWFFPIVLGGVVAFAALRWKERQRLGGS